MTYVAAVIGSNPQNYWRLNEGPGASAALDYGNQPGMLWASWRGVSGAALYGFSGFGFGGITADGGSTNVGPNGLWNLIPSAAGTQNPYTPLPEPGTLEMWTFHENQNDQFFVGWLSPSLPSGQNLFGITVLDRAFVANGFNSSPTTIGAGPQGTWQHVAMSWNAGSGFIYLNGSQASNITTATPVGGGHVNFVIGDITLNNLGLNISGLVTEVATYRRALTVGDLDGHFDQAELKGQRPHWVGPRITVTSSGAPPLATYNLGVTHVAISGAGTFGIPTGLRGLKVDIIDFPTGLRVLPGVPPYIYDVGWLSVLDGNGMLAEIRPNRDTRTWLPDNMGLATTVGYAFGDGFVVDITELDPV